MKKPTKKATKEERLAEALRANLRRRKAAARDTGAAARPPAVDKPPTPE